jgi:hypothetical protein
MNPPELKDLGWDNAGGETRKAIDSAAAVCARLGHTSSDIDVSIGFRGLDHQVSCLKCGWIYHYDSSD